MVMLRTGNMFWSLRVLVVLLVVLVVESQGVNGANINTNEGLDSGVIPGRSCGSSFKQEDMARYERQFESRLKQLGRRQILGGTGTTEIRPTTIDILWTVVTANETYEGGWLPQEMIDAQIDVLNRDYEQARISWRLSKLNYIHNRYWFEEADVSTRAEMEMKYLFHTGDASVLNLYSIGFNSTSDTLGYATIPQWYADDPVSDGVVVRHTTLPGGTQPYYRYGRTLTHEVGHWLGLYHTFQGGCEAGGGGDYVDDTSPEAEPSRGCDVGRDTCPGGDPDPIQNYMDYSIDQCMTGFSQGQIERMHRFIQGYRQSGGQNYTFPYWDVTE